MNFFIIFCFLILLGLFVFLSRIWGKKDSKHIFLPFCTVLSTIVLYLFLGSTSENSMKIVTSADEAKLAESIINKNNQNFTESSLEKMILGLEKRLLTDKTDLDGWILLARSYLDQKKYAKAIFAYERALDLSPKQQDLMADLADALTIKNDGIMNTRAITLIKNSYLINPEHKKTLALLATSAMKKNNKKEAIYYWERLKDTLSNDSDEAKKIGLIIETLLASTDSDLQSSTKKRATKITGEVFLSNNALDHFIANRIPSKAIMFIIAREINGSSMPIAVTKIELLPFNNLFSKNKKISFAISDFNSMIKDRSLSKFKTFKLQARLSYSGSVIPKQGDLFGEEIIVKQNTKKVDLKLSKVIRKDAK